MRLIICLFVLIRYLTAYPVETELDNTVAGGTVTSDDDKIKGTIRAVEDALTKDPKLPRLTRGEIISLINEVRAGKQVVVVLPENLNSTLQSMSPSSNGSTRRPLIKRRRKKPTTVRPVYVHSVQPVTASTESTVGYVKSTSVVTPSSTSMTSHQTTLTSTTVEGQPNIALAAQNLGGPDMTKLLTSFGLLGRESTTPSAIPPQLVSTTESTTESIIGPTVDPSVYSRFKPLPIDSKPPDVTPDMKSILESYGLLDTRQGKVMREMPDPMDSIPERELLEEMGILHKKKTEKSLKQPEHVFKPGKTDDESEMERVTTILSKLREMSDGNTTNADFNNLEVAELLLLENNTRLAAQQDIDPAKDGDQIPDEKNDIKRQQPDEARASASASASANAEASGSASAGSNTDSEATSTTTTEKSTDETTTERSASAQDLEDSFGGGGVAPAVTPAETTTTTQRPNGFYFLLDWNSFLDVGEDERAVHLNFSPKVGNPRDFISVKVP